MKKYLLITSTVLGIVILAGWGRIMPRGKPANIRAPAVIRNETNTFIPASAERAATTPDAVPAPSIADVCTGKDAVNFDCFERHYQSLVQTGGISAAFTDLRARYDRDGYVKSQCHPVTHVIGREAVALYPTLSAAYMKGDSFCWSGYYHGLMEGIAKKIGRENLVRDINTICADIPGKERYSFDYFNCVHGMGHGVMEITDDELFEGLALCDGLSGSWERESCYGGVFMENIIIDGKNHYTRFLKPDDLLYPCSAVGTQYKHACYLMQTSYMFKIGNGDAARAFAECARAETGFRATCYQSLGRDASGRSVSDPEKTWTTCNLGANKEQKEHCIIGAVKDFISYHHSDVQAKILCAALPPELQTTCLETAKSYYTLF